MRLKGPWFATKAPYWEGSWSDGTMSAGREPAACVWSVSTNPNAPGWNTDGGTSGYGVPEDVARLMAAAPALRDLLKEAREAGPINPYNEHADLAERIDAALKAI